MRSLRENRGLDGDLELDEILEKDPAALDFYGTKAGKGGGKGDPGIKVKGKNEFNENNKVYPVKGQGKMKKGKTDNVVNWDFVEDDDLKKPGKGKKGDKDYSPFDKPKISKGNYEDYKEEEEYQEFKKMKRQQTQDLPKI